MNTTQTRIRKPNFIFTPENVEKGSFLHLKTWKLPHFYT